MITIIQILITIFLAYIAWQNYKISNASYYVSKDNLRLGLLDRRYKVFDAFRKLFRSFVSPGRIESEAFREFVLATSDAEFLFNKDVNDYREEVKTKCLRLMQIERRLSDTRLGVGDERAALAEEATTIEEWIMNQVNEVGKPFRLYMHFSIDKHPNKDALAIEEAVKGLASQVWPFLSGK